MSELLASENAIAPATPAAGKSKIYPKIDGLWYSKDDAGTETVMSGGINQLTGDVTAGPGSGSQAATIANDAVTDAKLRESAALSVIGRAANSIGNPADIPAGSNGTVLRRSSNALAFAAVDLTADVTGDLPYANLVQASAASRLLVRGSAAGAGDWQEGTLGTGLSMSGTVLSASVAGGFSIAATVASNELIIALETEDGDTPSSGDGATVLFRDVTTSEGKLTSITVEASTILTVPDTATLGTSNSTAFRLWVVAFNDGGTLRLGVIKCASTDSIYALGGWGIASSTAIGTGSDSAQVFYTGSAVTAKSYTVLGYITYETGLATAGTWSSAPTRVQTFTTDTPLPGQNIQEQSTTYTTETFSSSSTFAATGLTKNITLSSAANAVRIAVTQGGCGKDTGNTELSLRLRRDSTTLSQFATNAGGNALTTANYIGSQSCVYLDFPNSSSAIAYNTYFASSANTARAGVQISSDRSSIILTELMA